MPAGTRYNYKRQPILNQADVFGFDAFPPHVHYEILLPGFDANNVSTWNRIDPIVYWTPALNPWSPDHATPDGRDGTPIGTGLHVFAIPVSDRDRNGTLDTTPGLSESAGVIREGGSSILQVGVNTPHTRSLALRIEFSERPAGLEASAMDGVESVTWQGNTLLVTLLPTEHQTTPNTIGYVRLSFAEESDDTNTASEMLTYTVRVDGPAGNVFSAGPSRSLYLIDNDTPTPELDPATAQLGEFTESGGVNTGDVQGTTASEIIRGVETDDQIYGGGGGDAMYGMGGNDRLEVEGPEPGASYLDGGTGDDQLYGSIGNDTLIGGGEQAGEGTDNDWLEGRGGNDLLRGGAGNDILIGGTGNDYLIGGPEDDESILDMDVLAGGDGDDTLKGGVGNDVLIGGTGRDVLYGGKGNDHLYGSASYLPATTSWSITPVMDVYFNPIVTENAVQYHVDLTGFYTVAEIDHTGSVLFGEEGMDYLVGGYGDDYLDGGDDWDLLFGAAGNDVLLGGDGNDIMNGGFGHDILVGGSGDDRISGDLLDESPYEDDVEGNDFLDGGYGNDQLDGHGGNDTYYFDSGYGQDQAYDTGGRDVVRFGPGVLPRDVCVFVEGFGIALQIRGTDDRIVLNDWMTGETRIEFVQFEDGTIWDETVFSRRSGLGLAGDDILAVSATDGYTETLADAAEQVLAGNATGLEAALTDLIAAMFAAYDGGEEGDTGTTDVPLDRDLFVALATFDEAAFTAALDSVDAGAVTAALAGLAPMLHGGAGADVLHGARTGDLLLGGAGDDVIFGLAGDDELHGDDVAGDPADHGHDQLYGGDGNDRLFGVGGNDVLHGEAGDDQLIGGDGDDIIHGGDGDDQIWGEGGNDTLYGDAGADIIQGGDGNDLLYGGAGNDTMAGDAGDDLLDGGAGTDYLHGGDGNDILGGAHLSDDYLSGTGMVNYYYGELGDDLLRLTRGTDNIYFNPGDGHDTLEFTSSSITYGFADRIFLGAGIAPGDVGITRQGNDVILSIGASDSITIRNWFGLPSSARPSVRFDNGTIWAESAITTQALVVHGTAGDDVIEGLNNFVDTLYGHEGNDVLRGYSGNDTLTGGLGDDQLEGGTGSDTYHYALGDGVDRIVETGTNTDTLSFGTGITAADIQISRDNNDLVFTISPSDRIVMQGALADSNARVESFIFTDGSTLPAIQTIVDSLIRQNGVDGDDLLTGTDGVDILTGLAGNDMLYGLGDADTLHGGDGNDLLDGGAGNDTLNGDAGDDVLTGGGGNDTLNGGIGNDTYVFGWGSGRDVVTDNDATAGNLDTVLLEAGVTPADVTIGRTSTDLLVRLGDGSDMLTIRNWYVNDASMIERIQFADGTVWGVAEIESLSNIATPYDDYIIGTAGPDIIDALAGDDRVWGGAGDDTLLGGDGHDTIDGGDGDDTILGGAGNESLSGDAGNDYIDGGDGGFHNSGNYISGGDGDDYLIVGTAVNNYDFASTVHGDAGNDTIIGSPYADWIYPGSGRNIIDGGGGDDLIDIGWGGDMQNTYIIRRGSGVDEVYADNTRTAPDTLDTVVFGDGITVEDLSVQANHEEDFINWSNLAIGIGNGDGIYIQSYNASPTGEPVTASDFSVGEFRFADGTVLSFNDILALADDGIAGSQIVEPDTVWVTASEGKDFIGSAYLVEQGPHYVRARGGDDHIAGYDFSGDDVLDGGYGDDVIAAGRGNNVIVGGQGDDHLWGYGHYYNDTHGDASNVFAINRGDGMDEVSTSANSDTISYGTTIRPEDILVYTDYANYDNGATIVFSIAGSTDVILSNWDYPDHDIYTFEQQRVEWMQFVDEGGIRIFDLESLIFARFYEILEATSDAPLQLFSNADAYEVTGIEPAQGGDRARAYAITDDVFAILGTDANDVLDGSDTAETIFGDTGDDLISGQAGKDRLFGGAGDDSLFGGTGSDLLVGGRGQDLLEGDDGNDVYAFQLGDGQDRIVDLIGADRIEFGSGIDAASLQVSRAGDDLVVAYSQTDAVTIGNWFTGQQIETVRFADGAELSASGLESLANAQPGNQPPLAGGTLIDVSTPEDALLQLTLPADAFTDPDPADFLTYSATLTDGSPLPAWLGFDPATRTFSGTPGNGDVGALAVRVTATDPYGASASQGFTLSVTNTNDAPTVAGVIDNTAATEDSPFVHTLPTGVFADDDLVHGDTLTLSATLADGSALPAWLAFDSATGTFSGIPGNGDVGNLDIRITATDSAGASVVTGFVLAVGNVNDAPELVGMVPDQQVDEYGSLSFMLPADLFTDADQIHGDTLSLGATLADGSALPAWLSFDAATRTFSGSPVHDDVGSLNVRITATDQSLATSTADFTITVQTTGNVIEASDAGGLVTGTSGADTVVGGAGADLVSAGGGNDILDGGAGNDILLGGAGNDLLLGGTGNDYLLGGAGNDLYRFGYGDGQDQLLDVDITTGNSDTVALGASALDIIFVRSGSALSLALHDSTDTLTVQGWGFGSAFQTEVFQAADGSILLNTQVDQLIQAMAQFSADTGLSWDQAIAQRPDEVQTILAAYWQAAA